MKKLIKLILLLFISVPLFSQSLPENEEGIIQYRDVIERDSISPDELFEIAKKWVAVNCNGEEFEVDNPDEREVKKRGDFEVSYKYDYKYTKDLVVDYQLMLEVKDERYRYTFDDFNIYEKNAGERFKEPLEDYLGEQRHNIKSQVVRNVNSEVKSMIENMKNDIEKGKIKDDDDW